MIVYHPSDDVITNYLNYYINLSNVSLLFIPDELKRNISQKAQAALLQILDATEVDQDNAAPMLTALVQTDPKAAGNR